MSLSHLFSLTHVVCQKQSLRYDPTDTLNQHNKSSSIGISSDQKQTSVRYTKFPARPISTECEFLVRVGRGRSTSYNSLCPTCQATRLGFDIISVFCQCFSTDVPRNKTVFQASLKGLHILDSYSRKTEKKMKKFHQNVPLKSLKGLKGSKNIRRLRTPDKI